MRTVSQALQAETEIMLENRFLRSSRSTELTCWVVALGVPDDFQGLEEVGLFVDVDVANAFSVTEDRNVLRLLLDAAHELGGAARDDEVDVLVHRQQIADFLAGGNQ